MSKFAAFIALAVAGLLTAPAAVNAAPQTGNGGGQNTFNGFTAQEYIAAAWYTLDAAYFLEATNADVLLLPTSINFAKDETTMPMIENSLVLAFFAVEFGDTTTASQQLFNAFTGISNLNFYSGNPNFMNFPADQTPNAMLATYKTYVFDAFLAIFGG